MLFNVQDPQFGDTVVQAAKFEDVESIYKTYLQSINATSTGSQIGISQAQNAPIGAHLITQFNNKGTLVGKIGDASSPLSFAKVKNLANMSSDDFFGNLYSPSTKMARQIDGAAWAAWAAAVVAAAAVVLAT